MELKYAGRCLRLSTVGACPVHGRLTGLWLLAPPTQNYPWLKTSTLGGSGTCTHGNGGGGGVSQKTALPPSQSPQLIRVDSHAVSGRVSGRCALVLFPWEAGVLSQGWCVLPRALAPFEPVLPGRGWRPLVPRQASSAAGGAGGRHRASRRGCSPRAGRTSRCRKARCLVGDSRLSAGSGKWSTASLGAKDHRRGLWS